MEVSLEILPRITKEIVTKGGGGDRVQFETCCGQEKGGTGNGDQARGVLKVQHTDMWCSREKDLNRVVRPKIQGKCPREKHVKHKKRGKNRNGTGPEKEF